VADIQLTAQQRGAVEDRGGSLLVSAAAGSGKTKVLVERVFAYLTEEHCHIDDFLIITFTRAAAAELRTKLAAELAKRVAQDPENSHLRQQMFRVYQADIILKILPPLTAEVMMMKPRTTLFSTVQFNTFSHEAFELMMAKRITAVAYELLADDKQRCPVLNVISEIEGTASITIASELLSNTQGGKGILLGGIPGVSPTEVVIIGAGNAGTVATRAAMALGASVKVFDDDINKLRTIQQVLGQGLFTSTFHPNVLQNAFRSADVVIGAMRYINTRHRYIIAEDMIRIMKRGALVIDLRINQGGCFETTCCLCPSDPAVFEQYGVLHYCRQNISNRVARTTSMALSNIFVPMLFLLGDAGAVQGMIKSDPGFKNGVYMYCGKPVNSYVSNRFGLSSNNIDLYLSAF